MRGQATGGSARGSVVQETTGTAAAYGEIPEAGLKASLLGVPGLVGTSRTRMRGSAMSPTRRSGRRVRRVKRGEYVQGRRGWGRVAQNARQSKVPTLAAGEFGEASPPHAVSAKAPNGSTS